MPKWLWTVALGLTLTPIFRVNAIVSFQIPTLFDDQYEAYRDAHPGLVGFLYFEIVMNVLLVLAAVGLNFFFQRLWVGCQLLLLGALAPLGRFDDSLPGRLARSKSAIRPLGFAVQEWLLGNV